MGIDAGLATGRFKLLPFYCNKLSIGIDILREPPSDPAEPALIQAQRVVQALRLSRTTVGLCSIAVNDVRRITGFDRVMVYRFDEDGSGDPEAPGVRRTSVTYVAAKIQHAGVISYSRGVTRSRIGQLWRRGHTSVMKL